MESKINARMSKKTQLVHQSFTEKSFSVNIPNYKNYDMLMVKIIGDKFRGISTIIPRALYDENIPLSIYASANSPVPTTDGYSIAIQGNVSNGTVEVAYATSGGWGSVSVDVYGIS
jgi:hypothetical protein